jgi:hypothetical protein
MLGECAEAELSLDGRTVTARLAIPERPRTGDEVLVADGGDGARYVIGILRRLREVEVLAQTGDGTTVRLRDDAGAEMLSIESADGTVLFEYCNGKSRICAPSGALELRAEAGDLSLSAAGHVRVEGDEGIELRSPRAVKIDVEGSHLSVTKRGAQLLVEELRAKLGKARAEVVGEAELTADTVNVVAETVRTVAKYTSVDADQLVERVRESYRDVAELAQTRAGQIRMVAEQTFRVLAERTLLKARGDVKLKGKTIYLD